MDLEGLEPSTSSVRLMRAPICATGPHGPSLEVERILPEANCTVKAMFAASIRWYLTLILLFSLTITGMR